MKFLRRIFFLVVMTISVSHAEDDLSALEPSPESSSSTESIVIKSISDLQQITPYSSISVIQKRYLPKTFRWESNASLSATINHTFFYLAGASGRFGFFLREDHGLGVEGFAILPPLFKGVTNDLTGPPNYILPTSYILPQFYGGLYYKWSPFFGKMALLDKRIIYFDTYFTLGAGVHKVLDGIEIIKERIKKRALKVENERPHSLLAGSSSPAFTLGVGQLFAFSQSFALNWELKWFYTVVRYQKGNMHTPIDLNFSLGVNYYFPEAGYR